MHNTYPVFNNTIHHHHLPAHARDEIASSERDIRQRIAETAVLSATWNVVKHGDRPKCHPETRVAIQNCLAALPNNRSARRVKLISGWAGTGKTTIALTMAEHWARQHRLAASFFFSRSEEKRKTTLYFAETILEQIFRIFDVPIPEDPFMSKITWEVVNQVIRSTFPLPQPMVILIDGLDECLQHREQVKLLTEILASLDGLPHYLKFVITCRPEPQLERVFGQFADTLGSLYRITLGRSPGDDKDLRTFFQVSFDRICQDRRRDGTMSIVGGPWPSKEQIRELVKRASGQFIFAVTVVSFVDNESMDPVKILDRILERRTSSFKTIDSLYILILERVEERMRKNQDPESPELCQTSGKPAILLGTPDFKHSALAHSDFKADLWETRAL